MLVRVSDGQLPLSDTSTASKGFSERADFGRPSARLTEREPSHRAQREDGETAKATETRPAASRQRRLCRETRRCEGISYILALDANGILGDKDDNLKCIDIKKPILPNVSRLRRKLGEP